jgi:hypothetical protein
MEILFMDEELKCPSCNERKVEVFNRMVFQTTERQRVVIGYTCGNCRHRWQVYYNPEEAPQAAEA